MKWKGVRYATENKEMDAGAFVHSGTNANPDGSSKQTQSRWWSTSGAQADLIYVSADLVDQYKQSFANLIEAGATPDRGRLPMLAA